mmetsp:Transcript_44571/g.94854  ORF Transcript_44571/g.94854 Transcript_44571/m.94854 type:complete len:235 (-) Transcript_44571:27-731(-)
MVAGGDGLRSLRQRPAGRRNSDEDNVASTATTLPLMTAPRDEAGNNRSLLRARSGGLGQQRRRMRSRRWERQLRRRAVFTNVVIGLVILFCSVGVVIHRARRPRSNLPSIKSAHETSSLPRRFSKVKALGEKLKLPFVMSRETRVVYDFFCKSDPEMRAVLNDDYCDCLDGSDEPHTSACSHLTVGARVYSCGRGGKKRKMLGGASPGAGEDAMVFSSKVKDGVVDCPNRSDER